jgi:hypothetical protein
MKSFEEVRDKDPPRIRDLVEEVSENFGNGQDYGNEQKFKEQSQKRKNRFKDQEYQQLRVLSPEFGDEEEI